MDVNKVPLISAQQNLPQEIKLAAVPNMQDKQMISDV